MLVKESSLLDSLYPSSVCTYLFQRCLSDTVVFQIESVFRLLHHTEHLRPPYSFTGQVEGQTVLVHVDGGEGRGGEERGGEGRGGRDNAYVQYMDNT